MMYRRYRLVAQPAGKYTKTINRKTCLNISFEKWQLHTLNEVLTFKYDSIDAAYNDRQTVN